MVRRRPMHRQPLPSHLLQELAHGAIELPRAVRCWRRGRRPRSRPCARRGCGEPSPSAAARKRSSPRAHDDQRRRGDRAAATRAPRRRAGSGSRAPRPRGRRRRPRARRRGLRAGTQRRQAAALEVVRQLRAPSVPSLRARASSRKPGPVSTSSSAATRSGWRAQNSSERYPPSDIPPITARVAPSTSSSASMSRDAALVGELAAGAARAVTGQVPCEDLAVCAERVDVGRPHRPACAEAVGEQHRRSCARPAVRCVWASVGHQTLTDRGAAGDRRVEPVGAGARDAPRRAGCSSGARRRTPSATPTAGA